MVSPVCVCAWLSIALARITLLSFIAGVSNGFNVSWSKLCGEMDSYIGLKEKKGEAQARRQRENTTKKHLYMSHGAKTYTRQQHGDKPNKEISVYSQCESLIIVLLKGRKHKRKLSESLYQQYVGVFVCSQNCERLASTAVIIQLLFPIKPLGW